MGCSENDSSPVHRRSNQRGAEGRAISHNYVKLQGACRVECEKRIGNIWYDMIWYDVSDSCMLVWPIQSSISMCTQTLCYQFDLLFFLLQVSCHYGAIPLDSVASSHPHLLACHFSYRILLQPLTNTLTKGPLANREHVLVCVWNVHQLLHIQRGAQLEQFWQSSHEDAHWWVNSWKNTLVKTVLSSQVHR